MDKRKLNRMEQAEALVEGGERFKMIANEIETVDRLLGEILRRHT